MKEFEFSGKELVSIDISPDIRSEGQKVYLKTFTKSWDGGVPLRVQVERKLREQGLLEDDPRIDVLRQELKDMEIELRSAKRKDGTRLTREDARQLALSMRRKREETYDLANQSSDLFSYTAETLALNEQIDYFTFSCTRLKNGTRYWKSFEEYKEDKTEAKTLASRALISNLSKTDINYDNALPENNWLKRFGLLKETGELLNQDGHLVNDNDQLIDEKGRLINAAGQLVDEFGNAIDENGNLIVEDGWGDENVQ